MKNRRLIITAIPLVICNLIAFTGQLAFIREHMRGWPLIGDIGLAAGLESIALFLTFMAADALMAEDAAFRLRIGSYLAAGIVAGLNYSHYAGPGMRPDFAAISTGLMSFMSPILWGIYSRRNSRDTLKAKGLIESRAVKFAAVRWLWWPGRTFKVYRHAAWSGETEPVAAITAYETARNTRSKPGTAPATHNAVPEQRAAPVTHRPVLALQSGLADAASKAARVRHALQALQNGSAPVPADIAAWLTERGTQCTPGYVRDVMRRDRLTASSDSPADHGD